VILMRHVFATRDRCGRCAPACESAGYLLMSHPHGVPDRAGLRSSSPCARRVLALPRAVQGIVAVSPKSTARPRLGVRRQPDLAASAAGPQGNHTKLRHRASGRSPLRHRRHHTKAPILARETFRAFAEQIPLIRGGRGRSGERLYAHLGALASNLPPTGFLARRSATR